MRKMNCPICNAEMIAGKLYGDRYELKWLPAGRQLCFGVWARGSEKIDSRTKSEHLKSRPYALGHKCDLCSKILLDTEPDN